MKNESVFSEAEECIYEKMIVDMFYIPLLIKVIEGEKLTEEEITRFLGVQRHSIDELKEREKLEEICYKKIKYYTLKSKKYDICSALLHKVVKQSQKIAKKQLILTSKLETVDLPKAKRAPSNANLLIVANNVDLIKALQVCRSKCFADNLEYVKNCESEKLINFELPKSETIVNKILGLRKNNRFEKH